MCPILFQFNFSCLFEGSLETVMSFSPVSWRQTGAAAGYRGVSSLILNVHEVIRGFFAIIPRLKNKTFKKEIKIKDEKIIIKIENHVDLTSSHGKVFLFILLRSSVKSDSQCKKMNLL